MTARDMNGLPRWLNTAALFGARLVALNALAAVVAVPAIVLIRLALAALG
jgi:hypothetical protein